MTDTSSRRPTQISLQRDQVAELDAAAARRGMTRSAYVWSLHVAERARCIDVGALEERLTAGDTQGALEVLRGGASGRR